MATKLEGDEATHYQQLIDDRNYWNDVFAGVTPGEMYRQPKHPSYAVNGFRQQMGFQGSARGWLVDMVPLKDSPKDTVIFRVTPKPGAPPTA